MLEQLLRPLSFPELPNADGHVVAPRHIQLHILRGSRLQFLLDGGHSVQRVVEFGQNGDLVIINAQTIDHNGNAHHNFEDFLTGLVSELLV